MYVRDKTLFISTFMYCWVGEGPQLMILPWVPISVSQSLFSGLQNLQITLLSAAVAVVDGSVVPVCHQHTSKTKLSKYTS